MAMVNPAATRRGTQPVFSGWPSPGCLDDHRRPCGPARPWTWPWPRAGLYPFRPLRRLGLFSQLRCWRRREEALRRPFEDDAFGRSFESRCLSMLRTGDVLQGPFFPSSFRGARGQASCRPGVRRAPAPPKEPSAFPSGSDSRSPLASGPHEGGRSLTGSCRTVSDLRWHAWT
jgi:hypothetical protein